MKIYSVTLLEKAFEDLDEIYKYIKDEFKETTTAIHFVDLLEVAIMSLEQMPYRGAVRKTGRYAQKGYRQLIIKNFTIIYQIDEESKLVIVMTIRYSPSNF